MNLPIVITDADITDDNIAIIAGFAENLSFQNDEVIQAITNSQIFNPQVQTILQSEAVSRLLEDESSRDVAVADLDTSTDDDADFGLLLFPESLASISSLFSRIKSLFVGLRKKVRKIFCQVVSLIKTGEDLDIKKIIRDVLILLVPALAASTGLIPVALPIVVSLAAMLLKFGVSKVCPVQ